MLNYRSFQFVILSRNILVTNPAFLSELRTETFLMVRLIVMRDKSTLIESFATDFANEALQMICFVHSRISLLENRFTAVMAFWCFVFIALSAEWLTVMLEKL